MKKLLIGLVAITGVLAVSCAKDYNCECTVTHVEVNAMAGMNSTYTESTHSTMKGKEEDVKSSCENSGFNMTYTDTITTKHTITSVCKIK